MKLLRIGFIAAVAMAFASHALAADAPKIDPANRAKGMKEAPAAVQAAGLDCTVADALFLGQSKAKAANGKDVDSNVYEVACSGGLGYFVVTAPGVDPQSFDCLSLRTQADATIAAAKGKPASAPQVCILPGNVDPKKGLEPLMAKANAPCSITAARYIGASPTDKIVLYETRCSNNQGYLLMAPRPGSTKTLAATNCTQAGLFSMTCQLTSEAEVTQQILSMSAAANRTACQPNAARWVVTSTAGDAYYEIGCADGKSGYIFEVDKAGAYKMAVPCANAQTLGDGCKFTNADVAKTAEAGLYTQQAKQIGYPCTVAKYQSLGLESATTKREVVEMACNEHPGSVWALLPTGSGGDPIVVNCLRSEAYGLPRCQLTPMSATYADLSNQIKAKGKTCDVTNARYIKGVRSQEGDDFVEVACSGASGGMVIAYTPAKIEAVKDVFTCKETAGTTRACTLSK